MCQARWSEERRGEVWRVERLSPCVDTRAFHGGGRAAVCGMEIVVGEDWHDLACNSEEAGGGEERDERRT